MSSPDSSYVTDFNPLSPHGERHGQVCQKCGWVQISIHSPRMGRDFWTADIDRIAIEFQSTLPAWGETASAGSAATGSWNFNPLSPHGERRNPETKKEAVSSISIHSPRMGRDVHPARPGAWHYQFQSTLPAWGETRLMRYSFRQAAISIHSPRMGRDIDAHSCPVIGQYFNPLSPHGERPVVHPLASRKNVISIHSPRMGRDVQTAARDIIDAQFQSTLPAWGETKSAKNRVRAN